MSDLQFYQFPYLSDNYGVLVHSPDTDETACIDCGVAATYLEALDYKGWQLTDILVTHHHGDHIGGLQELKQKTGARVTGPSYSTRVPGIDIEVSDGDQFEFAGHSVKVFHVPSHTMDLVNYYFEDQGVLFVGDALFAMGCGKAFEGTPEMMWQSLQKIINLPPATTIYCSHEYTEENAGFAIQVEPDNPALLNRIKEVDATRAKGLPTVPFSLATELETNPLIRASDQALRRNLGMEHASDEAIFVEVRRLRDNY